MNNFIQKNDMQELFRRDKSSADYFKKQKQEEYEINSWDDYFRGLFDGVLAFPTNTQVAVRRHLPSKHPNNPTGIEIHIPYMTTFDDSNNQRWYAYLFDTRDNGVGWRFLMFKPDRTNLLKYFAGELDLLSLYKTVDQFYIAAPQVSKDLIPVDASELPENAIPVENSFYNENIWFDPADLYYGMNVAPVDKIRNLAKEGRFY